MSLMLEFLSRNCASAFQAASTCPFPYFLPFAVPCIRYVLACNFYHIYTSHVSYSLPFSLLSLFTLVVTTKHKYTYVPPSSHPRILKGLIPESKDPLDKPCLSPFYIHICANTFPGHALSQSTFPNLSKPLNDVCLVDRDDVQRHLQTEEHLETMCE